MKKAALRGRPKIRDGARSYTVSLRTSERKFLVKKHGSLTNAIKTLTTEIIKDEKL